MIYFIVLVSWLSHFSVSTTTTPLYKEVLISNDAIVALPQVISLTNNLLLACWSQSSLISCQTTYPNSTSFGTLLQINTRSTNSTAYFSANPLPDGQFAVNFEGNGSLSNIYTQIISSQSLQTTLTMQLNQDTSSPCKFPSSQTLSDGSYIVVWTNSNLELQGIRLSSSGTPIWTQPIDLTQTLHSSLSTKIPILEIAGSTSFVISYLSLYPYIASYNLVGVQNQAEVKTSGSSLTNGPVLADGSILSLQQVGVNGFNQVRFSQTLEQISSSSIFAAGLNPSNFGPLAAGFADNSYLLIWLQGSKTVMGQVMTPSGVVIPSFQIQTVQSVAANNYGVISLGNNEALVYYQNSESQLFIKQYDSQGNEICLAKDFFNNCYQCFASNSCSNSKLKCNTTSNLCYCTSNSECGGSTPYCVNLVGRCTQCINFEQCETSIRGFACNSNYECGCNSDTDCPSTGICTPSGVCSTGLEGNLANILRAFAIILLVLSAIVMAISKNSAQGYRIICFFQQIYYLKFINVQYPGDLYDFLESVKSVSLTFFPNLANLRPGIFEPAPARFLQNGYSGYFFKTAGSAFSVILFLEMVRNCITVWATFSRKKVLKKVSMIFEWGLMTRTFLLFVMQLMYGIILELFTPDFSSFPRGLGFFIAIVTFISSFGLIGIWIFLIIKQRDTRRFPFMQEDFEKKNKIGKLLGVIHYSRRLLEPIIIVVCFNIPALQISLLLVLSCVQQAAFFFSKQIFRSMMDITMEIALVVIYSITYTFTSNISTGQNGLGIMITIISLLASCLAFLLVETIRSFKINFSNPDKNQLSVGFGNETTINLSPTKSEKDQKTFELSSVKKAIIQEEQKDINCESDLYSDRELDSPVKLSKVILKYASEKND